VNASTPIVEGWFENIGATARGPAHHRHERSEAMPSAPPGVVEAGVGEGLCALSVVAQLHDLTVADGEDGEELAVQLDAGELLAGLVVDPQNDVIVVGDELERVDLVRAGRLARSQSSTWGRVPGRRSSRRRPPR
jgi:hypothetical protein